METLTEKQIMQMSENDKIMYIVKDVLMARDIKSAVTLEQVIETGIKMGMTEDYPRGKADGHPWFPRTSVMMGVGSETAVEANEEFDLHRKKVKKTGKGRKGTVMVYWYDPFTKHELVKRSDKATGKKKIVKEEPVINERIIPQTLEEKKAKMEANPGMYRLVNGKLITEKWIAEHPDKFEKLYGGADCD